MQRIPSTGRIVPALAHYDRAMAGLLARWGVPGAALALAKDGRLVMARGYGLAYVEHAEPVRPDSLFKIASISKPITAAAILKLVEQGRLSLDAPAFEIIEHVQPPPGAQVDPRIWEITVRHLLQHSGGWDRKRTFEPLFHPLIRAGALALGASEPIGPEDVLRVMLGRPLDFDPGTRFAYSNVGYLALGRIVERITGQPYEQYVKTEILAPLGITRMQIGHDVVEGAAKGEVQYYDFASRTRAQGTFWSPGRTRDSAGGWIASAIDLVRFASALDGHHGPAILLPETHREMRARPSYSDATHADRYYGLGWNVRPGEPTVWWHRGQLGRTIAEIVGTSAGFVRAVLFNSRPESHEAFQRDVTETLMQAHREVTDWPGHNLFPAYAGPAHAVEPSESLDVDTSAEAARMRDALVETLRQHGALTDPAVADAVRAVPRHLFVPDAPLAEVYRDRAIGTKQLDGRYVSSSSQPAIMTIMLEQLALEPGQRVLEIGAGTGYNAALLARLVGPSGEVITIDVDDDIVETARAHLASAGADRVQVVLGDGALGLPEAAPFDRIVLTVAATDIVPAWWQQLTPGGRLLLPLRIGGIMTQKVVAFERIGDHLETVSVHEGWFMMLRGAEAQPQHGVPLGTETGLEVWGDDIPSGDPSVWHRLLSGPARAHPTGVRVRRGEVWGGLMFWLGAREPALVGISATGVNAHGMAHDWLSWNPSAGVRNTPALLGDGGVALVARQEVWAADGEAAYDIVVRSYGAADDLAACLIDHVTAWDRAGRPSGAGLRIRAYPTVNDAEPVKPNQGTIVVQKRHARLVLDWPQAASA